jgi:hypothetical protein
LSAIRRNDHVRISAQQINIRFDRH